MTQRNWTAVGVRDYSSVEVPISRVLPVVQWLHGDLSASPYVDIAGARMLGEIRRELAARSVALRMVEARAPVRDLLRKELGMSVGEISRQVSVDDALAELRSPEAPQSHRSVSG